GVDLGDQLALAVAGAQLNGAVGLRRCAVGEIRVILALGLKMGQRLLGLFEYLLLPGEELLAEILPLAVVHERLFVGRSINLVLVEDRGAILVRRHCYPMPKRANPLSRGRAYIEPRDGGQ